MHKLSMIQQVTKAQYQGVINDLLIQDILIDTRMVVPSMASQSLFVALSTARRDGHSFIKDAYSAGVRAFLVSQTIEAAQFPDAVFLVVPDTQFALQQLAVFIRQQYRYPIIGITGSNGKTIVKEWLDALLSDQFNIVKSPKSYNSQIGVPLSIWLMNEQHNLGIFEAGISQTGEMEVLEKMIRPSIGLFTNIGEAHAQGFLNNRQKINEKLKLFVHADVLIFCRDYPELNECASLFVQTIKNNSAKALELFTWSYKQDATVFVQQIDKNAGKAVITLVYRNETLKLNIPFSDAASIENAINCCCVMLYLGLPYDIIREKMAVLKPVSMRLELLQGEQDCIIINDAYNADLRSLSIGLDLLEQQRKYKRKTVFLSDMQQMGRPDKELYAAIAQILSDKKVERLFAVGPILNAHRHFFEQYRNLEVHFFADTEQLLSQLLQFHFEHEAILVKGARSFAFEHIILLLEQKIHQTVLSIDLSAMRHNLDVFRSRLKPGTKTMAMVKASSYGSGVQEIAYVLKDAGIDYLSVAYVDEGVSLRKSDIDLPIMVMSPSTEAFDRMIVWRLEPEIFNLRSLRLFLTAAQKLKVQQYPIHIKLDTGMHRLGFMSDELDEMLTILKNDSTLRISSIFSHFAASDEQAFDDFSNEQAFRFNEMTNRIITEIGYKPLLHLCNTAGIVRFPQYHYDMVRLGLGLYGIDSSNLLNNQLRQMSTLRTTIAQIKQIPAGETVGYSRKGKVDHEMRIATICIGYADGYPRVLGQNGAFVMIANKPAKIIGSIAMDMCMVDITNIDGVQEGDEVIVFGDALPIQQLAQWAGTIPYEIMTNIAQRVKRVYLSEAQ